MRRPAFTLIELIVVIIILGILAAAVAPRVVNTTNTAISAGLGRTLTSVRDAIERYAATHGGVLPGADGSEATFRSNLKDYLRGEFPVCPVGAKDESVSMVGTPGPLGADSSGKSWQYSYKDGSFIVNSSALSADNATRYDKL